MRATSAAPQRVHSARQASNRLDVVARYCATPHASVDDRPFSRSQRANPFAKREPPSRASNILSRTMIEVNGIPGGPSSRRFVNKCTYRLGQYSRSPRLRRSTPGRIGRQALRLGQGRKAYGSPRPLHARRLGALGVPPGGALHRKTLRQSAHTSLLGPSANREQRHISLRHRAPRPLHRRLARPTKPAMRYTQRRSPPYPISLYSGEHVP